MSDTELNIITQNIEHTVEELFTDNDLIKFLTAGSKKIRSKLAVLYVKVHGKAFNKDIYDIITAGELIHNASLLHDDVIDDTDKRRNITTLGKKYSPNASILAGDYVVSEAIKLLLGVNNSKISNIFNNCVRSMAKAEVKQYFIRGKKPSIETYTDICKGKTAGLFSAILSSCAICLKFDEKLSYKFGELFGIAFQLKNDLEENSAKEDKKNHIYTAVDILGIENALILSDNYKRELRELLLKLPDNKYRTEIEELINGL